MPKPHDGDDGTSRKTVYRYLRTHTRFLTEQAYADAYIPAEMRARVRELTEECKQALADRLRRCEWISEESRANAVKKAESMEVVIVTPEERTDFGPLLEALSADGINTLEAAVRYDSMERQMMLRLAGKPYVRGHRFCCSDPMIEANSVYEPTKNTFFMMAGALRPGLCDLTSRETLLATLGQTVAHEMSHGFDDRGVGFNWEGSEACILTEEDHIKFRERVQRMAGDMNRIELADGNKLDGERTFFEACADLHGLKVVLDLAGKTEGFDYDLFFRTLARKFYRSFRTRDEALSNYAADGHPAQFVRCNFIIAQVDEFYQTYPAVREGTVMYRAPEERAVIW